MAFFYCLLCITYTFLPLIPPIPPARITSKLQGDISQISELQLKVSMSLKGLRIRLNNRVRQGVVSDLP